MLVWDANTYNFVTKLDLDDAYATDVLSWPDLLAVLTNERNLYVFEIGEGHTFTLILND